MSELKKLRSDSHSTADITENDDVEEQPGSISLSHVVDMKSPLIDRYYKIVKIAIFYVSHRCIGPYILEPILIERNVEDDIIQSFPS